MTLAPCQFAHRADLIIANGSFDDVGPTPLAQQALQIYAGQRYAKHPFSSIASGQRWSDMI